MQQLFLYGLWSLMVLTVSKPAATTHGGNGVENSQPIALLAHHFHGNFRPLAESLGFMAHSRDIL